MKVKLQQIRQTINPFAGINFVIAEFNRIGIPQLFDKVLGKRVKQATYKYSDILLTWIYSNLCGAERLEDTLQLKDYFLNIPKFKFCSSDRIAGIFKSLSTFNLTIPYKDGEKSKSDNKHEFNSNSLMNKLLIETGLKTNLIKPNIPYTLDYDNYLVPTEKVDSMRTYKEFYGYSPGAAFIGKVPIFIEGRNGNSPAAFCMNDTLNRMFNALHKYKINVARFRSDAASYQNEIIHMLDKIGVDFFIRSRTTRQLITKSKYISWKQIERDGQIYSVGSFEHQPFPNSKTYRFVVTKTVQFRKEDKETEKDIYRFIITNNYEMSDEQVFMFYNQRGAIEKNFDSLGNDFNWKRCPFSFLNYNTTFLIIGAITSILYEYIIRKFSYKLHFVKRPQRLKSFIFSFITVAGFWLTHGDTVILKLFTLQRDYRKLATNGIFETG